MARFTLSLFAFGSVRFGPVRFGSILFLILGHVNRRWLVHHQLFAIAATKTDCLTAPTFWFL